MGSTRTPGVSLLLCSGQVQRGSRAGCWLAYTKGPVKPNFQIWKAASLLPLSTLMLAFCLVPDCISVIHLYYSSFSLVCRSTTFVQLFCNKIFIVIPQPLVCVLPFLSSLWARLWQWWICPFSFYWLSPWESITKQWSIPNPFIYKKTCFIDDKCYNFKFTSHTKNAYYFLKSP